MSKKISMLKAAVSPSGTLKVGDAFEETIQTAIDSYKTRLSTWAFDTKKEETAKKLVEYDAWLRDELPKKLKANKFISVEDLGRVVEWKMTRGQWRPRNLQFALSNPADVVKKASQRAFDALDSDDVRTAIKSLSELKGIGPASSSAVLSAYAESSVPFMSDEALLSCGFNMDYTDKEYFEFFEKMTDWAKDAREGDPNANAHRLEQAIWSATIGAKYHGGLIVKKALPKKQAAKGRKKARDESSEEAKKPSRGLKRLNEKDSSSEDTEPIATKKQKKDE